MTKHDIEIMTSSKKTDWETPDWFFQKVNTEFKFTLDAAARADNTKCRRFLSEEDNGLEQDWSGEQVWLNPPYGRFITPKWVEKARIEGEKSNTLVVCLLPARTDTKWFQNHVYHNFNAHYWFVRGRIKFVGAKTGAPFPSVVVGFASDRKLNFQMVTALQRLKESQR